METLQDKIAEAKKELEAKKSQMSKRDEKGKYRKLTYREKFGTFPVCWIIFWAIVAGSSWTYVYLEGKEVLKPSTLTIVNNVQAKERDIVQTEDTTAVMADKIYHLESTSGKKNYSKCEAIGKVNSIGYAIPGDGTYKCFDNHTQEMKALRKWIDDHKAEGLTASQLICHYNIGKDKDGKIPNDCPYYQNYLQIID